MKSFPPKSLVLLSLLSVLSLNTLTGCTSLKSKRGRAASQSTAKPVEQQIHWPTNYLPIAATFFVHNEMEISALPQVVWDILVPAETWPQWYVGASNVKVLQPKSTRLEADGVFAWRTMDLDFESRIREFLPPYRLSWESSKPSIQGYHAWLIIPTDKGCRVVTDESQPGRLAVAQKLFLPNKLRKLHDAWLAELKRKAEATAMQPVPK